ncbi:MAG: hypothetical protein M3470_03810 [Chloroflexota bacterium]|nr:hypothetical protein [Chloroflexota bacterium]
MDLLVAIAALVLLAGLAIQFGADSRAGPEDRRPWLPGRGRGVTDGASRRKAS